MMYYQSPNVLPTVCYHSVIKLIYNIYPNIHTTSNFTIKILIYYVTTSLKTYCDSTQQNLLFLGGYLLSIVVFASSIVSGHIVALVM